MKFELERAIKAFNLEFHFVRGRMQNKQSRRLVPKLAETQGPSFQTKFAKMAKIHFTREKLVVPASHSVRI